jgi:hypothetical protein
VEKGLTAEGDGQALGVSASTGISSKGFLGREEGWKKRTGDRGLSWVSLSELLYVWIGWVS